ncbi:dTDP-4-dehydrorhamnose reductase [Limihaloglobus sulfuriphilus]|uniref:dTDP-4-dehydrorhamnose reductase n=1 Tax=Limihaloglobus sulfuriphilus TaxID=1851148 RepID=A0A1Q2MH53_9BACT|nr:SDR family oxidoreductase [Limihaloglobus sulfuriphilus]AQQ72020.1 dTDP-4-dehydrorhamnose reductase [Limihaloglobus sulfuriphilus]
MKKILITGGAGFVGANCAMLARRQWDVYVTTHKTRINPALPAREVALDIADLENVQSVISRIRPVAIIHAAALSDTRSSAEKPELAMKMNADGTKNMAIAAGQYGAKLVYISTDLVYDGEGSLYSETDTAAASCHYGRSKLAGEEMAIRFCDNLCIARSATVYGCNINNKKNFAESLIEKLGSSERVKLFTDEYRSFIHVQDLCRILLKMAADTKLTGIYNAGGPQRLSRYEFGLELADAFGFDKSLIEPSKIDPAMFNDHRPKDCSMNISKLTEKIGISLADVSEGLNAMRRQRA